MQDPVVVYVVRLKYCCKKSVTAWSALDKARKWATHELKTDILWDESKDGDSWIGTVGGDIAATINRVEVKDPIGLASRYPGTLPKSRYILDDE